MSALEEELRRRDLEIRDEAYAVQREGALLFGVIDLRWRQTEEFAAAIGLRTANDKSFALQIAVGFRIFVCDNLAFSGDLIALRRKHTSGLDLRAEIARAMDRYQEGAIGLEREIEHLKEARIPSDRAKELIFDAFDQQILPVRFFKAVSSTFFSPAERQERTLWALHNAFTGQVKNLPPGPAFRATARLGRLFGLGHQAPGQATTRAAA